MNPDLEELLFGIEHQQVKPKKPRKPWRSYLPKINSVVPQQGSSKKYFALFYGTLAGSALMVSLAIRPSIADPVLDAGSYAQEVFSQESEQATPNQPGKAASLTTPSAQGNDAQNSSFIEYDITGEQFKRAYACNPGGVSAALMAVLLKEHALIQH